MYRQSMWLWLFLAPVIAQADAGPGRKLVWSVDAPSLDASEQRRLRDAVATQASPFTPELHDASGIFRILFRAGMQVPDFQRSPPAKWPASLHAEWKRRHADCARRVYGEGADGGVPRMLRPQAAVECQRTLSRALWAKFLNDRDAASVLELSVTQARGGSRPTWRINVVLFAFGAPTGRKFSREVERDALVREAGALTRALLEGRGEPFDVTLQAE